MRALLLLLLFALPKMVHGDIVFAPIDIKDTPTLYTDVGGFAGLNMTASHTVNVAPSQGDFTYVGAGALIGATNGATNPELFGWQIGPTDFSNGTALTNFDADIVLEFSHPIDVRFGWANNFTNGSPKIGLTHNGTTTNSPTQWVLVSPGEYTNATGAGSLLAGTSNAPSIIEATNVTEVLISGFQGTSFLNPGTTYHGGVSLNITNAAVPEPNALMALVMFSPLIVFHRRRHWA